MRERDHQALIQNLLRRQKKSYETLRGHKRRAENQSAHEIPETLNTERYLENEGGAPNRDEKDYKHPGSLEFGRRRRKSHSRRYPMRRRVTNIARREVREGPSNTVHASKISSSKEPSPLAPRLVSTDPGPSIS
ncbi:hypothetical protein U1Q18_005290 [Sarracenia purpurea var. burkii]